MKKILIIYFFLINLTCFSQTNSFSKVISPYDNIHSASFVATSIVKQGNNYLLALIGYDTANISTNTQSLYFAKVDSNGNNFEIINKYIQIDSFYCSGYGALIRTHNGGFCYTGDVISVYDTNYNPIKHHFIMLFDSNMNNVLTKFIPDDIMWEEVSQIKETYDHGFILTGSREFSDNILDVLIIKTDSLGNQLWKTSIPTSYYGDGGQIEETPDHGFLICGFRSLYIAGQTGKGDPFIIKTDSAGNLIWIKILGNPAQLDGTAAIAITQDSNYIVALVYGTYSYPWPNNTDFLGRLNVIKYAPDGNQIWNKMYDTIKFDCNVNKIQILPNNDFIVMGSCNEGINNTFCYFTYLFKFNENGDSLWRKRYSYTNNYYDGNYLYDNVLNSDGSITACGYVTSFSLTPTQQIWIMKTDSNGNSPACDYTGIDEIYYTINKGEVRVFPNPASNQITLAYPQLKEEGTIYIYNMLGQIVYEEKIDKGSSQTKLSIQHLKAGLYKVIIREKGMMIGEVSLVKE